MQREDTRSLSMLRPFSTGGYVYWARDGWSYLLILETEVLLDVLVLADPKTGEWRNLYKFDLNGERENNGDVVVFTTPFPIQAPVMLLTMLRQEKLTLLVCVRRITPPFFSPFWCAHVNSLASFDLSQ